MFSNMQPYFRNRLQNQGCVGFSKQMTVLAFKGFIKVVGTLWKSRRARPRVVLETTV